MKIPPNKQKQEFWELCGFHRMSLKGLEDYITEATEANWESPEGDIYEELPSIDLNNLFKYAVPKLVWWATGNRQDGKVYFIACMNGQQFPSDAIADKLEDAAFEAIYKALGGTDEDTTQ